MPTAVFAAAEMIVKVKEPQPQEIARLREGPGAVHLSPPRRRPRRRPKALLRSGAIGIAYETVTDARGGLPLLAPMSEVAGRMAIQVGAHCLEKEQGGAGILLGGVPGVAAAKVVILGGGVAGTNAARMAMGMEAYVTVIDRSLPRLYELDLQFGAQLHTLFSTMENIEREVLRADLVIGAVLVPGAAAPKLVSRAMVRQMKPRRGAWSTSRSTRAAASRPAGRPRMPTRPMSRRASSITASPTCPARWRAPRPSRSTTRPCPSCWRSPTRAGGARLRDDPHLRDGLNIHAGRVTHAAVARDLGLDFTPPAQVLAG